MRILLIDADSVIPNIALMKLATYHRNIGDEIDFIKLNIPYYPYRKKTLHIIMTHNYDKVYCSVIFNDNYKHIKGDGIIFGGTGSGNNTSLPDEIENIDYEYFIYPDNKMSYGFISRGCIRKCKFCVVSKKEGYIKQVSSVDRIVKHNKTIFLDNNILALPNHKEILSELNEKEIRFQFNQGLDIRLLDKENSLLLSKAKYIGEYLFAFDDICIKNTVLNKIKLLSWRRDWQIKMFIYTNPDTIQSMIKRVEILRELKILPYIMRDIKCYSDINNKFFTDYAAYCNQPGIFKNMNFETFLNKRHKDKDRIKTSLEFMR